MFPDRVCGAGTARAVRQSRTRTVVETRTRMVEECNVGVWGGVGG